MKDTYPIPPTNIILYSKRKVDGLTGNNSINNCSTNGSNVTNAYYIGKECKYPTCIDLFVFIAVLVALFNCILAIAENFANIDFVNAKNFFSQNAADSTSMPNPLYNLSFYCIYDSCFFAGGCILCLILALPCWRGFLYSSFITGMYGVLLLSQAAGYGIGLAYEVYSNTHDEDFFAAMSNLAAYIRSLKDNKFVTEFTIAGYVISGFSMCLLSLWHEFGLKYAARLHSSYICKRTLFSALLSTSCIFCFCLGFPLVASMKWFPVELPFQPRIISISIRWTSAAVILLCLLPPFANTKLSSFLFLLLLCTNLAMLIISSTNFSFPSESQWFGYHNPNFERGMPAHKEILFLWVLTSAIVLICFLANLCFKPKVKYSNRYINNFKIKGLKDSQTLNSKTIDRLMIQKYASRPACNNSVVWV